MIVRLTTLDQMRRKSIVFLLLGLLQFHHISARIITSRNFLEFNTNAPLESTGTAEDESQNVMVLKTNIVVSECNNGIQCSEQSPPDEDETDENSSEGEPAPSDHTPLSKNTDTYPPLNPNMDPYAPLNPNTDPYAPLNPNTDHYAPLSQNNPHLSQNTDTYPPLNPNTDPYAPLNPNTNHYAPLSQNNPHLSQNTDTYPPLNPNTDPYAPLNPNTDPYAPLSQNNPPLRQNTDTYPPLNPNTDTYAPLNKDTYTRPSQNQTPPMRRFKAEPKVLHNKAHDVHPANTEVINHFINEHSNTVLPFYAGQPLQYIAVETTPVRPTTLLPTTVPEESGVNTAEGGTTESPQVEDEEDDEEEDDDDDEEEEKEQATAGDTRDMAITTPAVPSTTTSSRPEVSTTMPPTVLTQKTMPATLHDFTSTTTTASTSTVTTVTTTTIPPVTKGDISSAAPSTSPTSTTQPTSPTTTSQPTTSTTTIQSTSPTTTIQSTSSTTTIQPTSRTTIIHSTSSTTIQSTSSTTTIQPTSSTTKIQSTSSSTTTIQPTSPTSTVRPSSTSSASPTKPKTPAPVKSTVKSLTTLRTTLTTTLTPPTVPKEVKPHFTTTVVRAPTTVITTITTEKPQRRTITSTRPPTKTPTPTTVKPQRRTTIKRRRVVSISSRPPPPPTTTTTETTTTSLPTTTSTRRPLITVKRIKPQPKVTTLKPLEITTLKQVAHVTTQVKPLVSSIQTIKKYITPARVTSTQNKHSDTDDGKNNISGSFREKTNSTKVKDICAGCKMKHGVGYMEHPDSCTHFYQCIRRTQPVPDVVVERTCPLGLYWNQAVLTCDYPSNVQCGKDICSPSTLKSIDGNCRGFFECSGGISVPRCCPSLHRFHPSSSLCIPDDVCNDDCPMTHKHNFTCDMRAIPGDRFAFEQKTAWNKWVHRKCPILTAFSEDICGCSMSAPDNTDLDCKPQIYIPFDNSTDDESGNHVHVRNKGVAVHDGYGHFDGKSHLKITRFSNGWFGDTVIVSVRYKQEGVSRHERQALVCNGDCDVHPSLYLGVADTDTEFFVKTYSSAAVNFTVPASASAMNHHAWQDVTYLLADGTLEGNVRGVSIAQKVKGAVETRQRALMIGGCEGAEGFQGSIDQIAIYLCKPKGR